MFYVCIYQVRSQLSWWWWGGGVDNLYTLEISSGWLKEYSVYYNKFFGCIIVLNCTVIFSDQYILWSENFIRGRRLWLPTILREVSVERCTWDFCVSIRVVKCKIELLFPLISLHLFVQLETLQSWCACVITCKPLWVREREGRGMQLFIISGNGPVNINDIKQLQIQNITCLFN